MLARINRNLFYVRFSGLRQPLPEGRIYWDMLNTNDAPLAQVVAALRRLQKTENPVASSAILG